MTDDTCGCASSPDGTRTDTELTTDADAATGTELTTDADAATESHWLGGTPLVEQSLPDEVETAMAQLLGAESVDTLGEFVAELHRRLGGESLSVSDLCHAGRETPHWGEVDGDRHHFQCFYDAMILAELVDGPVEIRTESPGGRVVEATVTESEFDVTPEGAVMSFGTTSDPDPLPDERPHEAAYGAICPNVKAFPDRTAYDEWAESVEAVTVGAPLAAATGLAAQLAGERPADAPEPL